MATLGLALIALIQSPKVLAASGDEIELWVRKGSETSRDAGHETLQLRDMELTWDERLDVQLGATRFYLGLPLARLIERHPAVADHDLALLHFANGMIVPVPLDHGRDRLDIFVARAVKRTRTGAVEKTFPEIPKRTRIKPDPRPITFGTNKVVVSKLGHPFAPDPELSAFSPWYYTDTLTGVEFATNSAWDAQFDAGPQTRQGRDVFLARCQYCHAVREVGATFGWDFVDPTPLHEYRNPDNLYAHIRFLNTLAAASGAMMPVQKDVEPSEVELLWSWMKEIAAKGPSSYVE